VIRAGPPALGDTAGMRHHVDTGADRKKAGQQLTEHPLLPVDQAGEGRARRC